MAKAAAERLLDDADADVAPQPAHEEAIRALALSTLGIVELWHGDVEVGVRHLDRALAVAAEAELEWVRLLCNAYLALGSLLAGRLGACELRARAAASSAVERGWARSTPAGVALTVLACVQFHWNLIDEADATLGRAEVALAGSREPPLLALHRLTRARVRAAQGRLGEGLEELERGLDRLSQWPAGVDLRSLLETEAAIIRAALGERDVAQRDLERAAAEAPAPTIGLARLALSAGEDEAALEYLDRALRWSERLPVAQQVEAWALTALAHDALADHAAAASSIERALELAEPGGFRQPLLSQGVALRPVLRRQVRFGTAHRALVDDLLQVLELTDGHAGGRQALPEQLTDREAAVLRFLPTMMSNQEIAAELFVSVNTVKTHLRSIYRKLGAADRREAVTRARDLHLLAPGLSRR
jgi:LuxR family maltose regulon positive regulatory protein